MKLLKVIVLSTLMFSPLYSQDETVKPNYALSFGIADNFRLDKFNMDISVKKILDDTHQLRLFLSPRVSTMYQDDKISTEYTTRNYEVFNYSIGVGTDYLWVLLTDDDMNMFGGTGMMFTYGNNSSKSTVATVVGGENINDYSNPFANIGIRGILGVEWKVTNKLGIHSEYVFTGSYLWSNSELQSSTNGVANPTTSRTSSGITLGSGVLFGLSVYL